MLVETHQATGRPKPQHTLRSTQDAGDVVAWQPILGGQMSKLPAVEARDSGLRGRPKNTALVEVKVRDMETVQAILETVSAPRPFFEWGDREIASEAIGVSSFFADGDGLGKFDKAPRDLATQAVGSWSQIGELIVALVVGQNRVSGHISPG